MSPLPDGPRDPAPARSALGGAAAGAEHLLEHAAWMRRLARRLVGDASLADDLVQETWHAALRSPPPEGRPVRPWLAHVVRNFARRARRGESRRRARERIGARPEGLPSAAELVERLEGQRHVVEALLGLEEPYRATLAGRFLDDLSAAEVARRAGLPEGTVRWRTKRGLELLRERLDARYDGNRGAWCAALLPWAAGREAGAMASASAVTAGVLGMKAVALAVGAASAVALAVLGWSALRAPEPPRELAAPPVAALAAGPETAAPAPAGPDRAKPAPPPALVSGRLALDGGRAARAEEAPAAAVPTARLHARFVDVAGRPVGGVELEALVAGETLRARSAGSGVIELAVPLEDGAAGARLSATRDGYARFAGATLLQPGETTWLGDVDLAFGGRVAGRVTDVAGRAVAGAEVAATAYELPGPARQLAVEGPPATLGIAARTAADGTYELAGAPEGRVRVWAHTARTRYAFSGPVEVLAGGVTRGVDLALEDLRDDDVLEGVVLDPDGAPVRGASVLHEYSSRSMSGSRGVDVDGEGRFRVRLGVEGTHAFTALGPDGRFGPARVDGVAPGTRDLELRLGRLVESVLVVRDPRGEPIERFGFQVHAPDQHVLLPEAREHPGGRAAVSTPAGPFSVTVVAPGFRTRILGPWPAGTELEALECTLEPAPGVRGRVVSADGPVAGARVGLHEFHGDRTLVVRNGFRLRFGATPELEATTGADGRFLLTLPGDGEYVVRAAAGGLAPAESAPFAGEPGELELFLGAGGAIEGRVLVPRGEDPTGTIVGVNRGDGEARTVRVGPDGRFRFGRLAPGPWEVRACDQELTPGSVSTYITTNREDEPWPWVCDVYAGELTVHDLDLRGSRACVLTGRLELDGESAAGWTASLWPRFSWGEQVSRGAPTCELAADGAFRLETERAGTYTLRLEHAGSGRVATTSLRLAPGEEPWSGGWSTAELAGTGARGPLEPDRPYHHAFVAEAGDLLVRVPLPAEADGTFHVRGVPAVAGKVVRWSPEDGSGSPESWRSVATAHPEPGGIARVALP